MRVEGPEVGLVKSIVRCWEEESEKEIVRWWVDLKKHQRFGLPGYKALDKKISKPKLLS